MCSCMGWVHSRSATLDVAPLDESRKRDTETEPDRPEPVVASSSAKIDVVRVVAAVAVGAEVGIEIQAGRPSRLAAEISRSNRERPVGLFGVSKQPARHRTRRWAAVDWRHTVEYRVSGVDCYVVSKRVGRVLAESAHAVTASGASAQHRLVV